MSVEPGRTSDMAAAVATLEVSGDAPGGWDQFSIAGHPVFRRAMLLLAAGSFVSAVFNYLYDTGRTGMAVRDLLVVSYVLIVLLGGLRIIGPLPRGLFFTAGVYVAVFVIANTLYVYRAALETNHHIPVYATLLAFIIAAAWGPLFLVFKWPALMNEFGFRRSNLASDIVVSSLIAGGMNIYFAFLLTVYGIDLKFSPVEVVYGVMYSTAIYIGIFGIMFFTWNRMRTVGMSRTAGIVVLFFLMLALEIPVCSEVIISGRAPAFQAVLGPLIFACGMALVMDLTFPRSRNIFPCMFIITGINVLLVAGNFMQ